MTATMAGKRILVAEDEYFIARGLAEDLAEIGVHVLGPVATVADALALIAAERLDGAVLDINLRGEMAYCVADALVARRVPLVLCTGYAPSMLPIRYADMPHCEKPVEVRRLAAALFARPH